MCLQVSYKKKICNFFCILKVTEKKESDPDPGPGPLLSGMDPRIRIRIKMSRSRTLLLTSVCNLYRTSLVQKHTGIAYGTVPVTMCQVPYAATANINEILSLQKYNIHLFWFISCGFRSGSVIFESIRICIWILHKHKN
jgi:hypothetical protein